MDLRFGLGLPTGIQGHACYEFGFFNGTPCIFSCSFHRLLIIYWRTWSLIMI